MNGPAALALSVSLVMAPFLAACGPGPDAEATEAAEAAEATEGAEATPDSIPDRGGDGERNTRTAQERVEGWRLLFDGETLDGWRVFRRDGMSDGWAVEDGAITRVADGAMDIITEEEFEDFELALEWRVEPGGNSGVFIRASEEVDRIFEGAPEMQILDDDRHVDGGNPLTSAGANYALHAPSADVVRPAGEWNQARVRVQGEHVTHWLNGVQVVDYRLWTDEWRDKVAGSKFADWPEYGTFRRGHIGLQDHGDRVQFRNIRIRDLE